jgi:hypothetical protein
VKEVSSQHQPKPDRHNLDSSTLFLEQSGNGERFTDRLESSGFETLYVRGLGVVLTRDFDEFGRVLLSGWWCEEPGLSFSFVFFINGKVR